MVVRWIATFVLLLHATDVDAAQLIPTNENNELSLRIESIAYPETLQKDLVSGLTNRILIRVTLSRGKEVVRQRAIEIAVRYDLWDERFAMAMTIDGVQTDARTIANMQDIQANLRQLRLPRLFATDGLSRNDPLTLNAEILLNPVDQERMEMIRKWVAENSIGPSSLGGPHAERTVSVAIFNKIFEQYANGAEIAAVWREVSISRPFRIEELQNERR